MVRTFNTHLLAAAFLASAVTAAPLAASAAPNVCALVTVAEASSAMGAASLPGKPHTSRQSTSCRYYSSDHTKNVFVQTSEAGDMMGAQQIGGKPLAGIGDKAIWAAGSLFVQKGGKYMQVGLYRNAASMQKMDPQIVSLAKTVAGRM
jgi:delta 1-pyrroline-5-carboxylate dehydrogenase